MSDLDRIPDPTDGRPGTRPLVAVFVGTDHHPFDRLLTWVSILAAEGWAHWFVQHGATSWSPTATSPLHGTAYVGQSALEKVLGRAGAVVTHGGPGMIMDAHLAGHTPIVVPRDPRLREHVDDHQLRFATRLTGAGRIHTAHDLADLRRHAWSELAAGRRTGDAPHDPSATVSARFGDLVVGAHQRRRTRGR